MTDLKIAQNAKLYPIKKIGRKLGLRSKDLELYGNYKAKISENFMNKLNKNPKTKGKLVLITATNPTPSGEGKTTVSIGLGDALRKLNKNSIVTLREPSLGPVFGMKGGAAGGGYSQAIPMEDLNLHFTGDLHAITSANNLLASVIDNHIYHGNELEIDKVAWKRCLDLNDRALRNIVIKDSKYEREDHFTITAASEMMAIFCLAKDLKDLSNRIDNITIGYTKENKPILAKELNITGAIVALLKDAFRPNLIQTLEGTPVIVHGGPFANIAHGCNSIQATKTALQLGDIVITEAGFGADLGAEKFFDIVCPGNFIPDAVVLMTTIKSLKYNGGVPKDELTKEDLPALSEGVENLHRHISNLKKFGVPIIVALNHFKSDSRAEIAFVKKFCELEGCNFSICDTWAEGGNGGIDLAKKVIDVLKNTPSNFKPLYNKDMFVIDKIAKVTRDIYGARGFTFKNSNIRDKCMSLLTSNLPICIAKTQYSLSDNPKSLGAPKNFFMTIQDMHINSGAGFIIVKMGPIMTMPGLPKRPAAENIKIIDNKITGLF